MNELYTNIEQNVNKYIESTLSNYNIDLSQKFNEELLFDENYMVKKIKKKLGLKNSNYNLPSEHCIIKQIVNLLKPYNIKIYYSYVNIVKMGLGAMVCPLEFYTNTNLKITLCNIAFYNGSGVSVCFSTTNGNVNFSDYIQPGQGELRCDASQLSKVIKYLNPNIYADYLLCCEDCEIRGLLLNGLMNNNLLIENAELKNDIQVMKNELFEKTNKLETTVKSILSYKEEIKQLESTNTKNNEKNMEANGIIDELKEENKNLFVSNNNIINKLQIYKYKIYLLCFIISCLASICLYKSI